MPTDEELLTGLASGAPPSNAPVGGTIVAVNQTEGTCDWEFNPTDQVLNAAGFIAAGYITQMLDQACAIAGIVKTGLVPTTLEIKTNCLRAVRPGVLRANARVRHSGSTIAFVDAELLDSSGNLVATCSSTTRLVDMTTLERKSGAANSPTPHNKVMKTDVE